MSSLKPATVSLPDTRIAIMLQMVRRMYNMKLEENAQVKMSMFLKMLGTSERNTRESTITIKKKDDQDYKKILSIMESGPLRGMFTASNHHDELNVYFTFWGRHEKRIFLNWVEANPQFPLKELIAPANQLGCHFQRRLVKIVLLPGQELELKHDKINHCIRQLLIPGSIMTTVRNHPRFRGDQNLCFYINAIAFHHIFLTCKGYLPYHDQESGVRAQIAMRVSVAPVQCKSCFKFIAGLVADHQCEGKLCLKCGALDHALEQCQHLVPFCTNCDEFGHPACNPHCPKYLNEVFQIITRLDIPLIYYESSQLQAALQMLFVL